MVNQSLTHKPWLSLNIQRAYIAEHTAAVVQTAYLWAVVIGHHELAGYPGNHVAKQFVVSSSEADIFVIALCVEVQRSLSVNTSVTS